MHSALLPRRVWVYGFSCLGYWSPTGSGQGGVINKVKTDQLSQRLSSQLSREPY